MVCGAAAGLLAGRGDIVVLPLVGTFVLRAYDDFGPSSVVFCPRFYGSSPPFYLSLVRVTRIKMDMTNCKGN